MVMTAIHFLALQSQQFCSPYSLATQIVVVANILSLSLSLSSLKNFSLNFLLLF